MCYSIIVVDYSEKVWYNGIAKGRKPSRKENRKMVLFIEGKRKDVANVLEDVLKNTPHNVPFGDVSNPDLSWFYVTDKKASTITPADVQIYANAKDVAIEPDSGVILVKENIIFPSGTILQVLDEEDARCIQAGITIYDRCLIELERMTKLAQKLAKNLEERRKKS